MSRSTVPDTEPAAPSVASPPELIPLSVLALDLDVPGEGWTVYLHERKIPVLVDDIGRISISRGDAGRLFDERREAEARNQERQAAAERQAIESDRQWRAQLPRGVPWFEVPDGVLPVVAMTAADRDAQPKRLSPLQEALAGSR